MSVFVGHVLYTNSINDNCTNVYWMPLVRLGNRYIQSGICMMMKHPNYLGVHKSDPFKIFTQYP